MRKPWRSRSVRPSSLEHGSTTTPALLLARAEMHPGRAAFHHKESGAWRSITWAEYRDRVAALAMGLRGLGVEPGDRVAVLADDRPEWVFADLAAEGLGAIAVGLYPTSSPAEVKYHLNHSGARVVVVDRGAQAEKVLAVLAECDSVERVVVIHAEELDGGDPISAYREVERAGRATCKEDPGCFERSVATVAADDVSCLVYTSGTTGPSKGAMMTHRSALAGAQGLIEVFGFDSSDVLIAYLPLCHLAERQLTIHAHLLVGFTTYFAESLQALPANMLEVRPTFYGAVPRVAQKLQASIEARIAARSPLRRRSDRFWLEVGLRRATRQMDRRRRPTPAMRMLSAAGERLSHRPLRRGLGLDRVRHALIGSAPVSPELMRYLHAVGIPLRQAYGQTEACGASHLHRLDDVRSDTVGVPVPGYRCKVDPDTSEVLLGGEPIFSGYWNDRRATAGALDGEWLRTGDLGTIEAGDHLRIIGRIKEIIITAGGKNVAPAPIENMLKHSPFVREAIVVGESRPYLTALIGLDYDAASEWARERGLHANGASDLATTPAVRELVEGWIAKVNEELARVEQVKKFRLLPRELDPAAGEVTATLKVRREAVAERYGELVAEMYR